MRASELLGLPVVGWGDEPLGHVLDVRLVQDGPVLGGFAALRVHAFVVGHHSLTARLGYDRQSAHGPWLVRWLVRRWTRANRYLLWEDAELAEGRLTADATRLTEVPELGA